MEILGELPKELKWNVLKFLRHPTAEIMREGIELYNKYKRTGISFTKQTFVEFTFRDFVIRGCDCCGSGWVVCNCTF